MKKKQTTSPNTKMQKALLKRARMLLLMRAVKLLQWARMLLLMRAVKLLQWARMLLGSEAAAKMSTDEYEAIWNNVLYFGGFSMSSEKVMAVCKGPMPETDKESIELEAVVDYALSMSKEDLVKKFEEW